MRLPAIQGTIDRRILASYRVAPDIASRLLPPPFRPALVGGFAVAGICLIRLKQLRPKFIPPACGLTSENAAHRIAVEWDDNDVRRTGVYIFRRDTNSRWNVFAGGQMFPGHHHRASIFVAETASRIAIDVRSIDGMNLSLRCRPTDALPRTSIFASLDEASRFYQQGSLGYSPAHGGRVFEGLELRCQTWEATPVAVEEVQSSFFDDRAIFPHGSIEFDSALLMRGIEHEWHTRKPIACACSA